MAILPSSPSPATAIPESEIDWARSVALSVSTRYGLWRDYGWDEDEAIQVARIAAWESWRVYDPGRGPYRTWAYPRIRGAVIDTVRRRVMSHGDAEAIAANQPDLEAWPDEAAHQARIRRAVEWALMLLSPRHRAVLAGYYLLGLSQEEIGGRLGVGRCMVHKLRGEALMSLRALFRERGLDVQDIGWQA
jgi:RNA polymerase sigma factor (sigma-70 family)